MGTGTSKTRSQSPLLPTPAAGYDAEGGDEQRDGSREMGPGVCATPGGDGDGLVADRPAGPRTCRGAARLPDRLYGAPHEPARGPVREPLHEPGLRGPGRRYRGPATRSGTDPPTKPVDATRRLVARWTAGGHPPVLGKRGERRLGTPA